MRLPLSIIVVGGPKGLPLLSKNTIDIHLASSDILIVLSSAREAL